MPVTEPGAQQDSCQRRTTANPLYDKSQFSVGVRIIWKENKRDGIIYVHCVITRAHDQVRTVASCGGPLAEYRVRYGRGQKTRRTGPLLATTFQHITLVMGPSFAKRFQLSCCEPVSLRRVQMTRQGRCLALYFYHSPTSAGALVNG